MVAYELGALPCPLFGTLDATLPFHHRPYIAAVLGELGEDGLEIHLAVSWGAVPSGPIAPIVEAPEGTFFPGGVEFGILHMEGLYELVVVVDIGDIVQLLEHKVAGVVEDVYPFVVSLGLQKALVVIPVLQ